MKFTLKLFTIPYMLNAYVGVANGTVLEALLDAETQFCFPYMLNAYRGNTGVDVGVGHSNRIVTAVLAYIYSLGAVPSQGKLQLRGPLRGWFGP